MTPLLTPAVQMLDQPHQEPTLTPAIGPATTSARSPPLHPCPGPALHAFFRGRGSGGGVGCGCSVPAGLGFLLASCRAWSIRQRRPPPGPPALLLHVGSTGPPSKSCLPQAGGACEGSGGDPRPEPLHPGRAGTPPHTPAAVKVRKETQSSRPTALDPPGRAVCWEPWREPGELQTWSPAQGHGGLQPALRGLGATLSFH